MSEIKIIEHEGKQYRVGNVPIQQSQFAILQDQITEMKVSKAIAQERQRCARVVRNFDNWLAWDGSEDRAQMLETIAKEIENGE